VKYGKWPSTRMRWVEVEQIGLSPSVRPYGRLMCIITVFIRPDTWNRRQPTNQLDEESEDMGSVIHGTVWDVGTASTRNGIYSFPERSFLLALLLPKAPPRHCSTGNSQPRTNETPSCDCKVVPHGIQVRKQERTCARPRDCRSHGHRRHGTFQRRLPGTQKARPKAELELGVGERPIELEARPHTLPPPNKNGGLKSPVNNSRKKVT
jgi:hypothetical protein